MTTDLVLLSGVTYRGRAITGAGPQGLLALLAGELRAGRSAASLIAGLWPDEQPDHPAKALQILVSRTRSRLGADLIVTTPTGYRLALTEDEVDATAVLKLASSTTLPDAEAGLELCAGAESWDGTPDDPLSALRASRVSAYRTLVRTRGLTLARLGRHADALPVLRELATTHPLDEEVLVELLRAEAATEGSAVALARYDAYRRRLRDEVGTDPGSALQQTHLELLAHNTPQVRHGVRHDPNPLLGRDADLAAVGELLRTARVTSIVGPGGLGKTRLAHAVARRAEQRVVAVVELAGITDESDVADEVAATLGVRTALGPGATVQQGIVAALGPALLVLDNCEHVVRGAADLVHALVSLSPDLTVLATSRAPLGLSSESVYPLPELDLPTMADLFGQRARAVRPEVELPADAVQELCARLDGLPLAVELAAARVRAMSVHEITRRIDDRFGLLQGAARDAPHRHRTLHAVIDWSWHLLTPDGQAAMQALSVFPGGFTADAARHVLGDDHVHAELEQLVDQSLLKVADDGEGTRFRMLETVREFSATHRGDSVIDRFLGWAREFGIRHHESLLADDLPTVTRMIKAEQDNLVQAQRHALDRADGATVAATAAVLGSLWVSESNVTRLVAMADETAWTLSHVRPGPELLEATRAAAVLATMCGFLIKDKGALRSLATLRRLPTAEPDNPVRAAQLALCAPDVPSLLSLCASEKPQLAGMANYMASYLCEQAGQPEQALAAARRMLACFEAADVPIFVAVAHARVGELCLDQDPGEPAYRHLHAALTLAERLGWWSTVTQASWALVMASLQCRALDEAERRLDELTQPASIAMFDACARAEILLGKGEVDAGLRLWREAADKVHATTTENRGTWPWQVQAVAVMTHARHHRLDLVADVVERLPGLVTSASIVDLRVCGSLLLALAAADLDNGATRTGVRLTALAERFGLLRGFHPTMSPEPAREAAERADGPAYADAVSAYSGLDRDGLRDAALAALRDRVRCVDPA